ncbi:hypothetical protein MRB53_039461 [Persea americana]|nr:hypothetical protein MRB53_039461 [Persea americana]
MLDDLGGTRGADLGHHHGFGGEGHDDGAGPPHEIGRVHATQPRVAAAGGVEVYFVDVGGAFEAALYQQAQAPRFERARWLEVVQFQEDSASPI